MFKGQGPALGLVHVVVENMIVYVDVDAESVHVDTEKEMGICRYR